MCSIKKYLKKSISFLRLLKKTNNSYHFWVIWNQKSEKTKFSYFREAITGLNFGSNFSQYGGSLEIGLKNNRGGVFTWQWRVSVLAINFLVGHDFDSLCQISLYCQSPTHCFVLFNLIKPLHLIQVIELVMLIADLWNLKKLI